MSASWSAPVFLAVMLAIPAQAGEQTCRKEGTLRSRNSDVSTTLRFINRSGSAVTVYWLDFEGRRVRYNQLQPGQGYAQQTYLTHPWVVVSTDGRCYGPFMPRQRPRTVVTP